MKCPHCGKDTEEAAQPAATLESEFANWYWFYPRKVGRGAARTAYGRARKKTDAQALLDGATRYARLVEGKEARFVCLPATWLNQERWADGEGARAAQPDRDWVQTPETWETEEVAELASEIGTARFNAWFFSTKIISRNPLTIAFPSKFKRDWVETHYQFQLRRAFGDYRLEVIS